MKFSMYTIYYAEFIIFPLKKRKMSMAQLRFLSIDCNFTFGKQINELFRKSKLELHALLWDIPISYFYCGLSAT